MKYLILLILLTSCNKAIVSPKVEMPIPLTESKQEILDKLEPTEEIKYEVTEMPKEIRIPKEADITYPASNPKPINVEAISGVIDRAEIVMGTAQAEESTTHKFWRLLKIIVILIFAVTCIFVASKLLKL